MTLTKGSADAVGRWIKMRNKAVAKAQGKKFPYYGAIGGEVSAFTRVYPNGRLEGWFTHYGPPEESFPVEVESFSIYPDVTAKFDAVKKEGHIYKWVVCHTSLGSVVRVTDETAGEEFDFTEYDEW